MKKTSNALANLATRAAEQNRSHARRSECDSYLGLRHGPRPLAASSIVCSGGITSATEREMRQATGVKCMMKKRRRPGALVCDAGTEFVVSLDEYLRLCGVVVRRRACNAQPQRASCNQTCNSDAISETRVEVLEVRFGSLIEEARAASVQRCGAIPKRLNRLSVERRS